MNLPKNVFLTLTTALAPLIWGSTYLVTTEFLPNDRPFTAAVIRVLPAGIILLLYTRELPARKNFMQIFLLAVLNIGFFQAMLFIAAYRLPGGIAAILGATQTIIVLILSILIGKKTVSFGAWFAGFLGIIGVALLVLSPNASFDMLGIISALLGALSMAMGIYFSKHWQNNLSVLAFTGWQLLLGGLCLLPFAIFFETLPEHFTAKNIVGYSYLCLFGAVISYGLFFRGVAKLPPAIVASLGLLSPICAFLLGWIFLGQSMSLKTFIGFILILISIYGIQVTVKND